jgi:hypothetical protein
LWAAALDNVPDDVPDDVPDKRVGWRVEVTRGGKYWHFRRGSHRNRQTLPGGKFESLSEERKQAYYDNARRQREWKEAKAQTTAR